MAEKLFTAKQAAMMVLEKAHEMLAKSELSKAETKHDRCVEHVKENSPNVKNPHAVCVAEGVKPSKWTKSENPDKDADAQLGEDVEHLCEEHMLANKDAERKEGHKIVKSEDCRKCQMKKYESENSKKLGYKLPEAGRNEAQPEKTDKDYEVERSAAKGPAGKQSPASHTSSDVLKAESDRLREQVAPEANQKEADEGNNAGPGAIPQNMGHEYSDTVKGHLKLAKFIGRMEHKRGAKKAQ